MTSFAALHDMTGKVAVITGGSRGIGSIINIGTTASLTASVENSRTRARKPA